MSLLGFSASLFLSFNVAMATPTYQVVGYCYTTVKASATNLTGNSGNINWSTDVPWNDLTVVNDAFAVPQINDTFDFAGGNAKGTILINAAHAHGVRCNISLGGGGQDGSFPTLCQPANRAAFASAVTAMVAQYGYDGVDIDWETPNSAPQADATAMMVDLYNDLKAMPGSSLDGNPRTLSFATVDYVSNIYNMTTLGNYTDWAFYMGYDWYACPSRANGPLDAEKTGIANVTNGSQWSYPIGKVILGCPLYTNDYNGSCGAVEYNVLSILHLGTPGAYNNAWAEQAYTAPNGDIVYVDTAQSYCDKTNWAVGAGLKGIGMWDLGQALPSTDSAVTGIWGVIGGTSSCLTIGGSTPTFTATSVPTKTFTPSPTRTFTSTSTSTATKTSTPTPSSTPTNTAVPPTATSTSTPVPPTSTPTASATPTSTPSKTATSTFTTTSTNTSAPPTSTPTRTATSTPSATASNTPAPPTTTSTPTSTSMPATATPTSTPTKTAASTSTTTPTNTSVPSTPTPTASSTSSPQVTATNTPVPPTATPTNTSVPFTSTPTASSTNSPQATATPTSSATVTSTPTSTVTKTAVFTSTATPTNTLAPATSTPTASSTSSPQATSTATASSTPTATFSSTPTDSLTSTWTPSASPTPTATSTLSFTPSNTPTPTSTHTLTPTLTATATPTFTLSYTSTPTSSPTTTWTSTLTPSAQGTPVVYPNPWDGDGGKPLKLKVVLSRTGEVKVKLFTTAFRKVWEGNFQNQPGGEDRLVLNLPNIANGVYYLMVEAPGKRWIIKLLVLG